MKNFNDLMKVLIILPVLLLILLLGMIGINEGKETKGSGKKTDMTSTSAEQAAFPSESEQSIQSPESEVQTEPESQETEAPAPSQVPPAAEEPKDPVIHLVFAGDILLSSHVLNAYDKAGTINGILDETYQSEINGSDLFIANQEFPFSDRGTAQDKSYTFRLPPARASIMKEIGVDLVSLANNHSLDYGTDALVDTCATLDGAGIRYMGAGPNMDRAKQLQTFEIRGKTIGFLAASRVYPDTSWVANSKKPGMVSGYGEPAVLLTAIEEARQTCDFVVVYVHWGIEKSEKPNGDQTALGRKIIDAGADMVIGSHPHVLQGIEYYKGKPICYSLGNYLFGSKIERTALLRADIDLNQGVTALSLVPGSSKAGYTKALEEPDKIREFYEYFQGLSFDVTVDENGFVHDNNTYTK